MTRRPRRSPHAPDTARAGVRPHSRPVASSMTQMTRSRVHSGGGMWTDINDHVPLQSDSGLLIAIRCQPPEAAARGSDVRSRSPSCSRGGHSEGSDCAPLQRLSRARIRHFTLLMPRRSHGRSHAKCPVVPLDEPGTRLCSAAAVTDAEAAMRLGLSRPVPHLRASASSPREP